MMTSMTVMHYVIGSVVTSGPDEFGSIKFSQTLDTIITADIRQPSNVE